MDEHQETIRRWCQETSGGDSNLFVEELRDYSFTTEQIASVLDVLEHVCPALAGMLRGTGEDDLLVWQSAADVMDMSLSAWIRQALDGMAHQVLKGG